VAADATHVESAPPTNAGGVSSATAPAAAVAAKRQKKTKSRRKVSNPLAGSELFESIRARSEARKVRNRIKSRRGG